MLVRSSVAYVILLCTGMLGVVSAAEPVVDTDHGDALLRTYFAAETAELETATFAGINTLGDWTEQRDQTHGQLMEMLGLSPLPEKTDLAAQKTGEFEFEDITVERLNFQSMPGLYVTANLYRPTVITESLPTVLYVCGHARVKEDGVSYGNKVGYHHHGVWFAKQGYVCLMIDTIQLGEIEGHHHGTHRLGMWWWNNRGYTPAGVEAWNCIRALDYLESREEVDMDRVGVTGRSGGGAYSWWIAAADQRIKVAVPVAGITDLRNHIVDDCVEGHCDCMFMVNTYRWDYAKVAALVAPRPLLIANSDKDGIFPLAGVVRVHSQVKKIYDLYGASKNLGLHITEGPHKDTQELRVGAFRWFNRFLKGDESLIELTAEKRFEPAQLKVFSKLPPDERVTTIHESFTSHAERFAMPESLAEFHSTKREWITSLSEKCFRGWPAKLPNPAGPEKVADFVRGNVSFREYDFTSEEPYRLRLIVLQNRNRDPAQPAQVTLRVLTQADCEAAQLTSVDAHPGDETVAKFGKSVVNNPNQVVVLFAPRGIGRTQWNTDAKENTHIRRRFMLLGQTADSMRIWDVRRAIAMTKRLSETGDHPLTLSGHGDAASWAAYASIFQSGIDTLDVTDLATTNREGLSILNVSRFLEMPQIMLLAADNVSRVQIHGTADQRSAWSTARKLLPVNFVDKPAE